MLNKNEKKNFLLHSPIIGRLTGVEPCREQARAKVVTNVIKEDERSQESKKRKRQKKSDAQGMISSRYKNKKVGVWQVEKRARLQEDSCVLLSRQES